VIYTFLQESRESHFLTKEERVKRATNHIGHMTKCVAPDPVWKESPESQSGPGVIHVVSGETVDDGTNQGRSKSTACDGTNQGRSTSVPFFYQNCFSPQKPWTTTSKSGDTTTTEMVV
jgi:hypothetical protein